MDIPFLINLKLTDSELKLLMAEHRAENPILFAIVGDIDATAHFGRTALLVFSSSFLTLSLKTGEKHFYPFDDFEEVFTKRMYSNALLRGRKADGTLVNIFRYTFSVAAITDSAADFFNSVKKGEPAQAAMEGVQFSYNKELSVCPKCGRTLASPGVPCIHCMGKQQLVGKFIKYLNGNWLQMGIIIFLAAIYTTLALLPPLLTKELVDNTLNASVSLTKSERLTELTWIAVGLVGIYFFRYGLSFVRYYMSRILGNRVISRLRIDVYEKAQHLPMRFYDKTSTGSVINRISGDTNTLNSFITNITQTTMIEVLRLIGIVVIMLILNPKLTLYSLIPVPIVILESRWHRKRILPYYRRIWRRGSAFTSVLTDSLPGIRVIKSFSNEENSVKKFSSVVDDWRKTSDSAGFIITMFPQIINFLMGCGSIAIWFFGGREVANALGADTSSLTVGLLVSFISYATMFYEPVNYLANITESMQDAAVSAERIMDILDAEPEHDFGKNNKNVNMAGRIEFRNVSFSFDRTKKVLKNINLVIEPGDIVGIVGTTGSGKSTLINLLLRYYDHYEGQIFIDGVDIQKIDMNYYRSQIGFVQQEPMMFHDTVANNISYGSSQYTVDEIINAADIANAHEFIIRQPNGYDTYLGERGTGLSGGERQRVSIARAMLRNPKLLVFDEATAAVDSETEHLIQEAIELLIAGRTTLMIAHRLSTLSKANKILVVDNGEVLEWGTPQELMAKKGKYYRLVQIQSMSDQVIASKRAENLE